MGLLLVWRHEPNIRKLLAGTESKLGQKAAPAATPHGEGAANRHGHRLGHGHRSSHPRKGEH
jgi:glycerol-3-phosphate acyltransferase PlsY